MIKANTKGLIAQVSDYGIQAARVSRLEEPYHVEAIAECPLGAEAEEVSEFMVNLIGSNKGQITFAICGVYPPKRIVRCATLENAAKVRDASFLPEYLKSQFKIDLEVFSISALSAADGMPINTAKNTSKELVFVGAPKEELLQEQQRLVSYGLYPLRMEIGTLSTMGGLLHHNISDKKNGPVLVLEISENSSQVLIVYDGKLDVARPIPHGLNSMYPIVQKELGLKDEASARKLFTASTFDFTEMGPTLLSKLMKELQASTGFYEVQTGQTIGHILLPLLPDNLLWIGSSLSRALGVEEIKINLRDWIAGQDITISEDVEISGLQNRWFSLFSLMANYNPRPSIEATAKERDDGKAA